ERCCPVRSWLSCVSLLRLFCPSRAPVRDSTGLPRPVSTWNPPGSPPSGRDPAPLLHRSTVVRLRQPELRPACVDARLDVIGHLDLGRPLAGALVGPLRRCVEADLAAE